MSPEVRKCEGCEMLWDILRRVVPGGLDAEQAVRALTAQRDALAAALRVARGHIADWSCHGPKGTASKHDLGSLPDCPDCATWRAGIEALPEEVTDV